MDNNRKALGQHIGRATMIVASLVNDGVLSVVNKDGKYDFYNFGVAVETVAEWLLAVYPVPDGYMRFDPDKGVRPNG